MKTFKQFIKESTGLTVYRGLSQKYSQKHEKEIIWVSTKKDHAEMYGKEDLLVYSLSIPSRHILDLGFRSVETEVKEKEILERLRKALTEQFKNRIISASEGKELMKEIQERLSLSSSSQYKQVWEHIHEKSILAIIKKAGFKLIKQNEGLIKGRGDVVTYGVLDKSLLKYA